MEEKFDKIWLISGIRKIKSNDSDGQLKSFEENGRIPLNLLSNPLAIACSPFSQLIFIYQTISYLRPLTRRIDLQNVSEYVGKIKTIFDDFVLSQNCSLIEFFTLITALHVVELLNQRKTTNTKFRPLMVFDVEEIEAEIEGFFEQNFEVVNEHAKSKGLSGLASPIEWLELVEGLKLYIPRNIAYIHFLGLKRIPSGASAFISLNVAKLIRCAYHGLDIQLAKGGIPVENYTTYTLGQLKDLVGKKTGQQVSDVDIVRLCLKRNFHAYSKSDTDNYYLKDSSYRRIPSITEVANDRRDQKIDVSYEYRYEGLVRMPKSVLKIFTLNEAIIVSHPNLNAKESLQKNHNLLCIELEPSFCEYLLGEPKVIHIRNKIASFRMTPNDWVFIQQEVNDFLDGDVRIETPILEDAAHTNPLEGVVVFDIDSSAGSELYAEIKKAQNDYQGRGKKRILHYVVIKIIIKNIKDADRSFDPLHMPGRVEEFYNFCHSIVPGIFPEKMTKQDKKNAKNNFRECCKGKNMPSVDAVPICAWPGKNTKPNPSFWATIKEKLLV